MVPAFIFLALTVARIEIIMVQVVKTILSLLFCRGHLRKVTILLFMVARATGSNSSFCVLIIWKVIKGRGPRWMIKGGSTITIRIAFVPII